MGEATVLKREARGNSSWLEIDREIVFGLGKKRITLTASTNLDHVQMLDITVDAIMTNGQRKRFGLPLMTDGCLASDMTAQGLQVDDATFNLLQNINLNQSYRFRSHVLELDGITAGQDS